MKSMTQNRWVSHVSPIQSMVFIALWEDVTIVHRVEDSDNEIKWKWTQMDNTLQKVLIGNNLWDTARN
jgi:hypothetical protein